MWTSNYLQRSVSLQLKDARRKQGYDFLNVMKWVLKDNKPGYYRYKALMQVDII
jgi:hypothetical protein